MLSNPKGFYKGRKFNLAIDHQSFKTLLLLKKSCSLGCFHARDIIVALNNPIVTWSNSKLQFKKWTINTKVFILLFDIHKSKLSVQMSQYSRGLKMKFFLVFLVNFGRMSFINWCFDGKFTWGFCLKINLLRNYDSTKNKWINSLTMNKTKSSSNWIWWGSFLL